MAHTIEDMQKARKMVCQEVAKKLSEFEMEYNVKICEVGYGSDRIYREISDDHIQVVGNFEMTVML